MDKNLKELSEVIHRGNVERGFWDINRSDETMLMLVITEVSEVVEADRKGRYANPEEYKEALDRSLYITKHPSYRGSITPEKAFSVKFESHIKDTVEDELADTVIRCLDLAGARGLELKPAENFLFSFKDHSIAETAYELTSKLAAFGNELTKQKINAAVGFVYCWCKHLGVDLDWHIEQKLRYNKTRGIRHGKIY
jgi:NTP pyrophosphatase (non-canonical NTP hydrolase)